MLRLRQAELTSEVAETSYRLRRVEHRIQQIDQEGIMSSPHVTMKRVEPTVIAELRGVAVEFSPENIGPVIQPMYPQLFQALATAAVVPLGPPIAYYNDVNGGDGIVVHAGVEVAPNAALPEPITLSCLSAIEQAASILHHGSMEHIEQTYEAMLAWLHAHDLRTVGYSREVYVACPGDVTQWVTELQFAVERCE